MKKDKINIKYENAFKRDKSTWHTFWFFRKVKVVVAAVFIIFSFDFFYYNT